MKPLHRAKIIDAARARLRQPPLRRQLPVAAAEGGGAASSPGQKFVNGKQYKVKEGYKISVVGRTHIVHPGTVVKMIDAAKVRVEAQGIHFTVPAEDVEEY